MNVGVDQARGDIRAAEVDPPDALIAGPDAGDSALGDGDVGLLDLGGKGVDHAAAGQHAIGRRVAAGDGE